jgi:outer membrane protein TolC
MGIYGTVRYACREALALRNQDKLIRILADNQGMKRMVPIRISFLLSAIVLIPGYGALSGQTVDETPQVLSLNDCLRIAMEKNHSRPASQFAVAMAEAQHRQALAGYWPQINAKGGLEEMSSSPNFMYPASAMEIPAQSITVPGGTATVTIPANAFGPGFPPVAVQMPVSFPGQTVNTNAQIFPIPAQDVKLMSPLTESVSGDFKWLLFDGGMRKGYSEQSLGAVNVAKAEVRRTDMELTENVIRLYYGAVLARQLHQLGKDTLERMEATLTMTESIYKDGSGTVNKTDYLDNKVVTETVRSVVAPLEANEASAEAALAYTIGLSWKSTVIPKDEQIPFQPYTGNLDELVSTAYEFNPDWAEIDAGLKAFEGERATAASGYFPKIGLKGELHKRWNSYDGGLSTSNNKDGWSVDLGVEIPIFDGFLTRARVAEARAKINQLKEKKLLLAEGLGLQLRSMFQDLGASEKVVQATQDAAASAKDDTDLTLRGYQTGLVATEKVIRAQLQEALVAAAHDKAVYDHRVLQARIDLVVGKSVQAELSQDR